MCLKSYQETLERKAVVIQSQLEKKVEKVQSMLEITEKRLQRLYPYHRTESSDGSDFEDRSI